MLLKHCQDGGSTDSGTLPVASPFSMIGKQESWNMGADDTLRPREVQESEKKQHTLGKQMADEINLSGVNVIFVAQQPVARRWGMH